TVTKAKEIVNRIQNILGIYNFFINEAGVDKKTASLLVLDVWKARALALFSAIKGKAFSIELKQAINSLMEFISELSSEAKAEILVSFIGVKGTGIKKMTENIEAAVNICDLLMKAGMSKEEVLWILSDTERIDSLSSLNVGKNQYYYRLVKAVSKAIESMPKDATMEQRLNILLSFIGKEAVGPKQAAKAITLLAGRAMRLFRFLVDELGIGEKYAREITSAPEKTGRLAVFSKIIHDDLYDRFVI
ncbi:MAG: hypothetical protein AAB267_06590, partial [Candidatus Desantisbacteria bacterium]